MEKTHLIRMQKPAEKKKPATQPVKPGRTAEEPRHQKYNTPEFEEQL